MKRLTAISFLLMVFFAVQAQMQDPVKFKSELKTGSGPEAEMIFSATIDPGWHVYSTNLGQDGPIEASLHVNKKDGVELVGKLTQRSKNKDVSQQEYNQANPHIVKNRRMEFYLDVFDVAKFFSYHGVVMECDVSLNMQRYK